MLLKKLHHNVSLVMPIYVHSKIRNVKENSIGMTWKSRSDIVVKCAESLAGRMSDLQSIMDIPTYIHKYIHNYGSVYVINTMYKYYLYV